MDNNESFGFIFIGFLFGILVVSLAIKFIVIPMPRIVGFEETGYYTKYKGTVYQLTIPQTADSCGSGKTSTNTEIPSFLKDSVKVDDSQKQR